MVPISEMNPIPIASVPTTLHMTLPVTMGWSIHHPTPHRTTMITNNISIIWCIDLPKCVGNFCDTDIRGNCRLVYRYHVEAPYTGRLDQTWTQDGIQPHS